MSEQETCHLFGTTYAPDAKTNPRHRAFLRKAIKLYPTQELLTVFAGQPTRLRLAMGSGTTSSQFGKTITSFTDPPEVASQRTLGAYHTGFDRCYNWRGNELTIRNPRGLPALQEAEQAWHDYIVPYRAARGMGPRPAWALEPLPGLQWVQMQLAFPTPLPTSPAANRTSVGACLPAVVPVGSRWLPIDLTGDNQCLPEKRKRSATIVVSDSEEEHLHKKTKKATKNKFLGFIDLMK
ncbi:hypothetical protein B0H17DRAFT_1148943 [Mycena rosella]|uniref:Uncharacterized protein n=1 Tax=Mycena rosella TaxID=1033263 RepID=A0AAD7C6T3_MYCRO|nr:hypothetical protein B0H17DRAFT_1148943 [Mycena rosella]